MKTQILDEIVDYSFHIKLRLVNTHNSLKIKISALNSNQYFGDISEFFTFS